jgi:hypothetical protein
MMGIVDAEEARGWFLSRMGRIFKNDQVQKK